MPQTTVSEDGAASPLPAAKLSRPTDLANLPFATTEELQTIEGPVGQRRALDAIRFGTQIDKTGFNLFVIGPNAAHMRDAVRALVTEMARSGPSPSDWVYVNNFSDIEKPVAIELPSGRAQPIQETMRNLIDDLGDALPAVFQSEDYQTRRSAIDESFHKKQEEALSALREKAASKGIVILRTPMGFALAPARDGQVVPPDDFKLWSEDQQREVQAQIEALEKDLEHVIHHIPQWERERRDEVRQLNRNTAKFAVDQLIDEAKAAFCDIPRVAEHFDAVRLDLVENVALFIAKGEEGDNVPNSSKFGSPFDRYEINVLVAREETSSGAPVIEVLHPTLGNLLGRIEYVSSYGVLVTNFRLIKAGAIHRANGGYLLLDARSVLMEPFSWAELKRTLRRGEIAIEDVSRFLGLTSTRSLEPDPIPLKLKVILFGDRLLYFLLAAFDPDLGEHFKVLADFEDEMTRTPESELLLARLVASIARREGTSHLDREAVGRLLEHAARLASHGGKLSLLLEHLREVLIEANFFTREAKRSVISRADVDLALESRVQRFARLRDRTQEALLEKVALIDTSGARVGQINGLSVFEFGGIAFGRPTRITCQVRPGSGKVVDIEREVELGGPLHSKGVMILSGFLAGHYALDTPMSLFASLVFEQSYGGVEGDSASSAELYALLSALAEAPLRQDLAVTGSVNQHGRIQAIGGVNEKIEGFFDICKARGLSGTQGVVIPEANVQHLMLRGDVIEACAAGRFAVYPIATADQGISLLTGRSAGLRVSGGDYEPDSINRLVEDRLRAFARIRKSFAGEGSDRRRGS